MSFADWVSVMTSIGTFLIAVALLLKGGGVWQATREAADQQLARDVAELKTSVSEKADCGRVGEFQERLEAEHAARREFVDKTHEALTRIRVDQSGLLERMGSCERDVKELRRKVFNGGR